VSRQTLYLAGRPTSAATDPQLGDSHQLEQFRTQNNNEIIIEADIPRIWQSHRFFQTSTPESHPHLQAIRNLLLLCYSTGHKEYLQGFHEIFGVIYYLFYDDGRDPSPPALFSDLLDQRHLEADVYLAAKTLLKLLNDGDIQFDTIRNLLSGELQTAFRDCQPSLFFPAWVRMLFSADYELDEVAPLWTRMFALGVVRNRYFMHDLVVARINAVSREILDVPDDLVALKGILKRKVGLVWLAPLEAELPDLVAPLKVYVDRKACMWESEPRECIVDELSKIGGAVWLIEKVADLPVAPLPALVPMRKSDGEADGA
jgi:hypothetical protein